MVEIKSRRGETYRLRNPWRRPCNVTDQKGKAQILTGDILEVETTPGDVYRVLPQQGALTKQP